MKARTIGLLFFLTVLMTACSGDLPDSESPNLTEPAGKYQYQVGLGYGFLGKHVRVSVEGQEILSIVGTEEIEDFAQLLGTKMLGGGSTDNQVVSVEVVVGSSPPFEQAIDLAEGGFIHIYYQENGLKLFNTKELILE
jgi:hypothetical protein